MSAAVARRHASRTTTEFEPDAGLGQLRGLDSTDVVHVHQPGRDSLIAVLADESAPAGALLQADQTGMLERAQGLTKGIARAPNCSDSARSDGRRLPTASLPEESSVRI